MNMSTILFIFVALILCIAKSDITPIHPTIINGTGEYYIIDNTSTYNFLNESIVCNYYNKTEASQPRNCYIICSTRQGCKNIHVNCNNSLLCSMNCTDTLSCSNGFINASLSSSSSLPKSNNFNLMCMGSFSCSNLNITYNNRNTNIKCTYVDSCLHTNINGFYSNTSIECLYNNSCQFTQINLMNNNNISLLCNNTFNYSYITTDLAGACSTLTMNAYNSTYINITSGFEMLNSHIFVKSSHHFVLNTLINPGGYCIHQTNFDLIDVDDVILSCGEIAACYQSTFNIYNNSNVTWWCGYRDGFSYSPVFSPAQSCYGSVLHAPNANKLDIIMYSSDVTSNSITGPAYYINNKNKIIQRTNIKCMYDGCYLLDFHSKNGLLDYNIYFDFPYCFNPFYSYCKNISSCVGQWQFFCANGVTIFDPWNSLNCNGVCCNNSSMHKVEKQINDEYNDECGDDSNQFDWKLILYIVGGCIAIIISIAIIYLIFSSKSKKKGGYSTLE